MRITILKEMFPGEARVALVPESVKRLKEMGAAITVEQGAGLFAGASDQDYIAAGATIGSSRKQMLAEASVLASIHRLEQAEIDLLGPQAFVIGMLKPLDEPKALLPLIPKQATALAFELVPRITRAQSMDVLSSMATVVGYKAVLLAASRLGKMLPMMMTAAGTVPPAKVLVLGAGVAGLQAVATAKRLGAVVEAYDVRKAAGEQVRSLGAVFLDADLGGLETEDKGGYAKELSEEALQRGRDLVAKHAKSADIIITTAQVPGRKAPLMLTEEAALSMKPGSIIVDLAAASGGNCPLTKAGEEVYLSNGAVILAPLNLAATAASSASRLYSRNLESLLKLMMKEGSLHFDMQDEIISSSCVMHQGSVINDRVKALLGG